MHADSSGVTFDQMLAKPPTGFADSRRGRYAREAHGLSAVAHYALRGRCVKSLKRSGWASPLAAAHAAEALQLLLSACAAGQNLAQANPFQMTADLKSARESLTNSLANLDIMLGLIEQVENL